MATGLFLDGNSSELIEHPAKMTPLERSDLPEDMAAIVCFLAGPESGRVNGRIRRANGGMVCVCEIDDRIILIFIGYRFERACAIPAGCGGRSKAAAAKPRSLSPIVRGSAERD